MGVSRYCGVRGLGWVQADWEESQAAAAGGAEAASTRTHARTHRHEDTALHSAPSQPPGSSLSISFLSPPSSCPSPSLSLCSTGLCAVNSPLRRCPRTTKDAPPLGKMLISITMRKNQAAVRENNELCFPLLFCSSFLSPPQAADTHRPPPALPPPLRPPSPNPKPLHPQPRGSAHACMVPPIPAWRIPLARWCAAIAALEMFVAERALPLFHERFSIVKGVTTLDTKAVNQGPKFASSRGKPHHTLERMLRVGASIGRASLRVNTRRVPATAAPRIAASSIALRSSTSMFNNKLAAGCRCMACATGHVDAETHQKQHEVERETPLPPPHVSFSADRALSLRLPRREEQHCSERS